ncbi:hydrolase 76 protein [Tulasnella sp. JGI-2019a]|nr:hydrolase 76 protein [Tulasnella sp. JGI-2019a]
MRPLVLLTSASPLLYLSAASPIEKRAQCASQLSLAATIADRLVSYWYNPTLGYFNSGSLWTDANTYEDMNNLMLAAGTDTYYTLDENSQTGKDGQAASASTWASTINGSNDDSLWLVLTMWKIADYLTTRGKDATGYLNSATEIYNMIAAEWDTTNCGGGVWWSTAHTYKNAITNELFLLTSASGYLRTGEASYLANAQKVRIPVTWDSETSADSHTVVGMDLAYVVIYFPNLKESLRERIAIADFNRGYDSQPNWYAQQPGPIQ